MARQDVQQASLPQGAVGAGGGIGGEGQVVAVLRADRWRAGYPREAPDPAQLLALVGQGLRQGERFGAGLAPGHGVARPDVPGQVKRGDVADLGRQPAWLPSAFTSGLHVPGLELRLHQLARLAARQVIHEAHGPGRLEAGDLRLDERDDLLLELRSRHGAGGGLYEGGDRLPHFRVGNADDGDVVDGRVQGEDVLGLLRVDVDPAGDNRERPAVGQEQEAVLVEVADVAEGGPGRMLGVLGRAGLVRVVVVGERDLVALEVDAAGLARGQFGPVVGADPHGAEDGPAYGARARQPGRAVDGRHAVALGAGVVLHQDGPPPVDHLLLDLDRARGRG